MATMTSFCRITGHARSLPKPCYFPILPPLSPADAKKLCRITGKATDKHNYCPIVAFGKPYRFDGLEGCKITQHENLSFSRPVFIKYKENEKTFDHLTQLLEKMKNKRKKKVDVKRLFVYKIHNQSAGIVLPPEIEEALRTGEIENLSVSKDIKDITIKIKESRTVKVQMETIENSEINLEENYYYGEGQSRETLEEQQKVLNDRNKRKQDTMARKKVFEQKEQLAEDDFRKATERPKSKRPPIKFDPLKRKEKLDKMRKIIEEQKENKAIILPNIETTVSKVNPDEQVRYEKMLEDIVKCHKSSFNITTVFSCNFDWAEIEQGEQGFDWDSFPKEDVCEPVEVTFVDIEISNTPDAKKTQPIDIAASVETLDPPPEVNREVLKAIKNIDKEELATTENVIETLKNTDSTDILPSIKEIKNIVSKDRNMSEGYLVKNKDGKGTTFVKKGEYTLKRGPALSGAMVTLANTQRFVAGMIVHLAEQESFVAGQTIETPDGKRFIPGQTVIDEDGEISFIPGHRVSIDEGSTFLAGHVVDNEDGPHFVPGQMVDRGDHKPVFMPGQTILTENGPKFVPGEVTVDRDGYQEFVPGMRLPTSKGEQFLPGQTFQSKDGITFAPGQIIDTEEGPSFVSGKSFVTPEGNKRFVRGEMINTEDGKISFEASMSNFEIPLIKEDLLDSDDDNLVITNEDLQMLTVSAARNILGFEVKPSNITGFQPGEKLYGDIVETDSSVLFYLSGKLPEKESIGAKIISGQLEVSETSQRFVPGKMMNTMDGEKFVPGQIVKTDNGEEFVPGQFVESADGPKFIPGQTASTSEGDKFIPGQVVLEDNEPKFVPGQIIQTKNGATFIPGQMMTTDKGQKFVPGQLVDTKDGPMFVPGQVIETNEGPKFISGTVVETEDGLKYLPHASASGSITEESEEDSEISFQGFDISPEEIQLLTLNVTNARPRSPLRKDQGLVDSLTLKKLAADTMVIHGRTPEPSTDKNKKKKKKVGKITIDALDDDANNYDRDVEDFGTNKVEILKALIKAGTSVSSLRKEKELRKLGELLNIDELYDENETEMEAIKFINANSSRDIFDLYTGNDEDLVADILFAIGNVENVSRNDEVTNLVNDAIKKIITKRCDEQIDQLISKITNNPESLFTDSKAQVLLTEAVGIVCVTGDVEVASLLEKFISEPTNPSCLKNDKDVLAVLRQVLVLNRIAERDEEVARVLHELQDDPEGVKDRNKVRKLIREAKSLLVKEKKPTKSFDVRHVTSSKDIPKEIFEQIRQDKNEAEKFMEKLPDELFKAIMGDERCGGKLIDSLGSESSGQSRREVKKFKSGMAVVVTKDNVEAVIPRHYARSIYYGIMPYLLIDEEGFKFFERGLTGRKLAPSRVIENTWFQPDSFYEKGVLYPQTPSGTHYNLVLLGDSYKKANPSLEYTSLLPSSEPTRISYLERRASRERSMTPLRRSSRSTTPSRRFSTTALYDPYSSGRDSFTRRHSMSTAPRPLSKKLSPVRRNSELLGINNYKPNSSSIYGGDDDDDDDLDQIPVTRSDTVGRLLDKYSTKTSLADELEYKKPKRSYKKHNNFNSYLENEDDEKPNRYRYTPEISEEPIGRYSQERFKDYSVEDIPLRGKKNSLHRPFSDIYELDELDNPSMENGTTSRSLLLEAARKNMSGLDEVHNASRSKNEERMSYTDRLRDWKNKYNKSNSVDPDEERVVPRTSQSRYGSVINDDDDDLPLKQKHRSKHSPYKNSYLDECDDSDDFSMEKFRKSLRQKYSCELDNLNKNLNTAYRTPSPKAGSRLQTPALNKIDERDLSPTPRKRKQYGRSMSDSVGPKSYGKTEDDIQNNFLKRGSVDNSRGLMGNDPYSVDSLGEYRSPYSCDVGGYGSETNQLSLYARPSMGYGQPMYGYNQTGGYTGYGAPPMYGGGGMNMYSQRPQYGAPPVEPSQPRYGGGYETPMNRYGYSPVVPPRYGYGPSGGYGNTSYSPYTGATRRRPAHLNLSDDDDDDNDNDDDILTTYNPKAGQRRMASQIARKYIGDSDNDDDL